MSTIMRMFNLEKIRRFSKMGHIVDSNSRLYLVHILCWIWHIRFRLVTWVQFFPLCCKYKYKAKLYLRIRFQFFIKPDETVFTEKYIHTTSFWSKHKALIWCKSRHLFCLKPASTFRSCISKEKVVAVTVAFT